MRGRRKLQFLLLVLCLSFAFVLNCGDDDDDDDDGGGEEDDDVADDDATDDDSATDDDTTDDDSTDDDDTSDDDDDDDDTVSEAFNTDDGTAENGFGWNIAGGRLAKVFMPTSYPSTLTEISIYLTQDSSGHNYTIQVWTDSTGGTPDDAVEVWSSGAMTANVTTYPSFQWLDFDLTAKGDPPVLNTGTWVISFTDNIGDTGLYVAVDENFGGWDNNCYGYDAATPEWGTISYFYSTDFNPGTLMIRGEGYY